MSRARIQASAVLVGTVLLATLVAEQNVRDLTGREVSSDEIIQALAPKEPPHLSGGSRGLGLVTDCKLLHKDAEDNKSRGIEPAANSEGVALTVQFASGSAELTPGDEKTLAALGNALDSNTLKACCFEIQGHTDSVGGETYNMGLSDRRARAVVDYLASRDPQERNHLLAQGYGKTRPIAKNDTSEGRAKNRRVQIINLGYGNSQ
jgi:outer membrane protein OmpA-like peptidoglycan-associated protein